MDAKTLDRRKNELLKMRTRLIQEVSHLEASIPDASAPSNLSNLPTHLADIPSEGVEQTIILAQNEEGILELVEEALRRIEQGTYGKCQECGRVVSAARLDALPYTPYCIDCAQKNEIPHPE